MTIKWPAIAALLLLLSGISFFVTLKFLEEKKEMPLEQQSKVPEKAPVVVVGLDNIGCDGEWGTGRLKDCKVITLYEAGHGSVFQIRDPEKNLDKLETVDDGMRITSWNKKPNHGDDTGAVYIHLGPELEQYFQGKRLLITTYYTPDGINGSSKYGIAYSTNSVGGSGWQVKNVAKKANSNGFHYRISKKLQKSGGDYIGIWGDADGAGGSIIVRKVTIAPGE